MKILNTDDNGENLYLIEALFRGHGHEVVSVRNGREALAAARANRFDVIVSDLLMPQMDGFQLIRELREDPQLSNIPIVIYTATYTDAKDEVLVYRLGADRFLIKPADSEDLLRVVEEAIRVRGSAVAPPRTGARQTGDEASALEEHNARLIVKLEKKMQDLERVNHALQEDIQARERVETELRRINRTSRMISECDQVLVRATDEAELLRAICRLVVDVGGYRLAWVGFAEQDEAKSVRPVAQAGFEEGYLEIANITWADTERGGGPVGRAIRTEEAAVARNILTDPALGPWREAAIQRGYAALAAFPLKRDQRVFGALTVYTSEPDPFDSAEVSLLTQLADDLAYGITALRTRLDQKRIEDELHLLSARLLQVRDLERRHLARELHDTTAQHLAALSLGLANLKGLLAKNPERAAGLCAECLHLAHQAAQEIRTHSYLLHPPLLEAMGLVRAVEDYAQGFSARSGIAVEVKAPVNFGRLPENMELALFRIVQESLANVLKHSRSARAEIRLTRQRSSVMLNVRDMGRGIPADSLARFRAMRGGSGVGLGGMQERMRLLGGELDLDSGPTGTTVCATAHLSEMPLESQPNP